MRNKALKMQLAIAEREMHYKSNHGEVWVEARDADLINPYLWFGSLSHEDQVQAIRWMGAGLMLIADILCDQALAHSQN